MAQFLFESGTALHIMVTFITNLAMYGKVGPLLQSRAVHRPMS